MSLVDQLCQLIGIKQSDERAVFTRINEECSSAGKMLFVGDLLKRAYEKFPNHIALEAADRAVTYAQLYAMAAQLAKNFKDHGVAPRDRVIVYAENDVEFYIAYYAALVLRAVATPVNTFLHEKELAHIVNDAEPKIIFVMQKFVEKFEALKNSGLVVQLPQLITEDVIDWNASVSQNFLQPDIYTSDDELAILLYTSGTTGVPKGVMLSSRNAMSNALQVYARFLQAGLKNHERFFCVLPLFHAFAQNACIWFPALTGGTVILVARVDRKLMLDGLQRNPTVFLGFPALFGLLCLMKTAPLSSVKVFISGADALSDKIRAAFAMIYGRRILSGYGLSEASPVISVAIENEELPTNFVGRLIQGVDAQIRDESNAILSKPNEVGTLWVKGDNIMLGYYRAPEATAKILVEGWLNTGDLASFNEQGVLAIRGRIKDLIIHKGFNIYPQEVENVLLKHPHVFKAAVVGKMEDSSGQVPVAYVAVRGSDIRLVEEGLRKLCNEHLAAYKVPRQIICLEDLPMNATGKVDKKQLGQPGV